MADQVAVLNGAGNLTTSSETTGTAITINKPSNTANNDLLVAVIYKRVGNDPYSASPAGWTSVVGPGASGATGGVFVYWKRISSAGTEPASYSWTGGGSNGRHAGMIFRVTGTHETSPVYQSSTTYTNAVSATPQLNLPEISATAGGTLLALAGLNVTAAATGSSLGFSAVGSAITSTGATESQMLVMKMDYSVTTPTGNVPLELSPIPSSGIGHLIAFRSPNQDPVVNAGANQTGAIGTATSFTATVTDPDGSIASRLWTQVVGPAELTMSGNTTNTLTVTPTIGGVYQFKITATDDVGAIGHDYVALIVPAPDGNVVDVISNPGAWNLVGSKPTEAAALTDLLDQSYIETPDAPNGAAITMSVGTVTSGNITVTVRGRQASASPVISRKVELLQGTTVIATQTYNLSSAWTDYPMVLTNAQNAAVTNRATLRVRITDTQAV
jgi:hypothetical protein